MLFCVFQFYAGLCKSKWEKSKRFPAGDYEYVDVNVNGTRYIVEVYLVEEFEIARPTSQYASLLEYFPKIYVGKLGELKQTVRIMSRAIKQSMKSKDMAMPPWRRKGYMTAKWFGSYKRTTNAVPTGKASEQDDDALSTKRRVGFEALASTSYYCRDGMAKGIGLRVGLLTAAFES